MKNRKASLPNKISVRNLEKRVNSNIIDRNLNKVDIVEKVGDKSTLPKIINNAATNIKTPNKFKPTFKNKQCVKENRAHVSLISEMNISKTKSVQSIEIQILDEDVNGSNNDDCCNKSLTKVSIIKDENNEIISTKSTEKVMENSVKEFEELKVPERSFEEVSNKASIPDKCVDIPKDTKNKCNNDTNNGPSEQEISIFLDSIQFQNAILDLKYISRELEKILVLNQSGKISAENIKVTIENRYKQLLRERYSETVQKVIKVETTIWQNLCTKCSCKQIFDSFKQKRSIKLFKTVCFMYGDMTKFIVNLCTITQDKHKKMTSYKSGLKALDDYLSKLESMRNCLNNNEVVSNIKSSFEKYVALVTEDINDIQKDIENNEVLEKNSFTLKYDFSQKKKFRDQKILNFFIKQYQELGKAISELKNQSFKAETMNSLKDKRLKQLEEITNENIKLLCECEVTVWNKLSNRENTPSGSINFGENDLENIRKFYDEIVGMLRNYHNIRTKLQKSIVMDVTDLEEFTKSIACLIKATENFSEKSFFNF